MTHRTAAIWTVTAALGFQAAPAAAYQVEKNELTYTDGRYVTRFQARLDAAPEAVWRLVTDYDHLPRLSRVFRESRVVVTYGAHHHRVSVVQHACVWFLCKSMRKVADVTERDGRDLLIVTDPAESDFSYSLERWRMEPAPEGGTRVYYDAAFTPAFFVPPVIGPWMVKAMFREELSLTAGRLESLADKTLVAAH